MSETDRICNGILNEDAEYIGAVMTTVVVVDRVTLIRICDLSEMEDLWWQEISNWELAQWLRKCDSGQQSHERDQQRRYRDLLSSMCYYSRATRRNRDGQRREMAGHWMKR